MEIKEYQNYIVTMNEILNRGIFFRNPIKKVRFEVKVTQREEFPVEEYINALKRPTKKLFKYIVGKNSIIINKTQKGTIESEDNCELVSTIVQFPLYFNRPTKQIDAVALNEDANIESFMALGNTIPNNVIFKLKKDRMVMITPMR